MIAEEIIPVLNQSTTQLLREIGRFSSRSFNTKDMGDGWNAGQISEHLLLTDISILRVLQGGFEFAGRAPDEKVGIIKTVFEDDDNKLDAPDVTVPSDMMKDPVAIQQKISRERHAIINFTNTIEEDSLCTAYSHPEFGRLTITEWIWFIIYHTERHIRQLQKMDADN